MNLLEHLRNTLEGRTAEAESPERAQRLAAAVLLLQMEHADHHHDPAERAEVARQLQEFFDLSESETAALVETAQAESRDSVSLHAFLRALNNGFTVAEKREVLEMLWRVAYADRHLAADEEAFLREIADLLFLPHREFIKAKLAVLGT